MKPMKPNFNGALIDIGTEGVIEYADSKTLATTLDTSQAILTGVRPAYMPNLDVSQETLATVLEASQAALTGVKPAYMPKEYQSKSANCLIFSERGSFK